MKSVTEAIFIHSLFRSGSTYIFDVFRRSSPVYWCYQEPLNEFLVSAGLEPEKLLEESGEIQTYLRHPKLEKPYFYEFYAIADKLKTSFREGFSYEQYFFPNAQEKKDFIQYFSLLIEASEKKQAVFQCCRTTGRVELLQQALGGIHIFLCRNPWDQWWSYKTSTYFDVRNIAILNAKERPSFLKALAKDLNLPYFYTTKSFQEYSFIVKNRHWLGSESSYKLFYALWCHAMLEALPYCDLSLDIDKLSYSNSYRTDITKQLAELGIAGLDFSKCSIPSINYTQHDSNFFLKIETYIHDLLLFHGYSHDQVDTLVLLSKARLSSVVDDGNEVDDIARARLPLLQLETELPTGLNLITGIDIGLIKECIKMLINRYLY
ncbi:MAG: hypothetical protein GQ582_06815 [Methyloprofundus sp.]|nr:hypothetical protein [Methyloprofundus sp.]